MAWRRVRPRARFVPVSGASREDLVREDLVDAPLRTSHKKVYRREGESATNPRSTHRTGDQGMKPTPRRLRPGEYSEWMPRTGSLNIRLEDFLVCRVIGPVKGTATRVSADMARRGDTGKQETEIRDGAARPSPAAPRTSAPPDPAL